MTVCVFGDSIAAGQFVSVHESWVARLSGTIDAVIENVSRSGDTTRLALERMPHDIQAYEVGTLVVQFGMNDCNRWESDRGLPRVSAGAFHENLTEIVARARAFDVETILLLTNHPSTKNPRHRADNRNYNRLIRHVAQESETGLVDIEGACARHCNLDILLPDGVHLNEAGHRFYANLIGPALAKATA